MERYRIDPEVGVYFVTFTVVEWLPVFIDENACKIITDSLNFCHEKKSLRINAYVIMTNHLHAIVFDAKFDSTRLKHTLDDFRKITGGNFWILVRNIAPPLFRKNSANMQARTASGDFGSLRNTRRGSHRISFILKK